jgi:hypothetical protein
MKRIIPVALIGAAVLLGSQANAAVQTYRADFSVAGLSGPFSSLSGNFRFTADLNTNLINDLTLDSLSFVIGSDVYTTANTVLDIASTPFSEGARDFIIGRFGAGSGDTNNSFLLSSIADFRIRFNLDANNGLLLARGGYRPTGGTITSFDTSQGNGVSSTFSFAAVPEPASWALMIGGFGLVGTAARRRNGLPAAA